MSGRATGLPVYAKTFGREQADRLLWRAGLGPRRGEGATLAKLGVKQAVLSLTQPGPEVLEGPEPKDEKGRPIAPIDARGHDHLWWLDSGALESAPRRADDPRLA